MAYDRHPVGNGNIRVLSLRDLDKPDVHLIHEHRFFIKNIMKDLNMGAIGTFRILDDLGSHEDCVEPIARGQARETDYVDCAFYVSSRNKQQKIRFFFPATFYKSFMDSILEYCEEKRGKV